MQEISEYRCLKQAAKIIGEAPKKIDVMIVHNTYKIDGIENDAEMKERKASLI